MKTCKSCIKEINEKAKKCPYCQTDQRNWLRRHPVLTFLVILILSPVCITALVGFYTGLTESFSQTGGSQKSSSSSTPTPAKQDTFVANVNFTGTEFVIANLDPHTCQDARMKVNGDYTLDHYNLESGLESTIKTGEATVYKVGAGQFTKGDGTRFNPFITKPKDFNIECRGTNELKSAFWYGTF